MLHIKHVALNKQTYSLKSTLETNIRAQLQASQPNRMAVVPTPEISYVVPW